MATPSAGCTGPIKAVTSAYSYFQSHQYNNHKDEFADLAFGQAGAEISRRWRDLPDEHRAKFEAQSAEDRKRHELECETRDAEVVARQAANRDARNADPASQGYMRQRAAVEPKKERKVTRVEDMSEERLEARRLAKAKRDLQKSTRLAAEAESDRQKNSIAAAAAAMARKRWVRGQGDDGFETSDAGWGGGGRGGGGESSLLDVSTERILILFKLQTAQQRFVLCG